MRVRGSVKEGCHGVGQFLPHILGEGGAPCRQTAEDLSALFRERERESEGGREISRSVTDCNIQINQSCNLQFKSSCRSLQTKEVRSTVRLWDATPLHL